MGKYFTLYYLITCNSMKTKGVLTQLCNITGLNYRPNNSTRKYIVLITFYWQVVFKTKRQGMPLKPSLHELL